jgi:hypothetical protein
MAGGLGGNAAADSGAGCAALGAGIGWGVHLSASRLAFGWDGFRFADLETIENQGEKKVESA